MREIMKLWRRASGVLKDKNSLWIAAVTGRSKYSHPDLEAAVIKATSHDESFVDYKNTQRVFAFVRTSPVHLLSFVRALSRRMNRTRNSIVAIKGLMLLHGVLCTKIPAARTIGRLPFDLSNFNSSSSDDSSSKRWAFNSFIRSYFAFLDQKSVLLSKEFQETEDSAIMQRSRCDDYDEDENENVNWKEEPLIQTLKRLHKWQALLDILLNVHPRGRGMNDAVILEAMDCVIIEVFDVYSKICDGIANVLVRVYASGSKVEAATALEVLLRANRQGDDLADYFELCTVIGLLNASECPKVERIPEEDIQELKRIINGAVEEEKLVVVSEERAVSVEDDDPKGHKKDPSRSSLMTIITHEWEVFEDDMSEDQKAQKSDHGMMMMDIGDLIDLSDEVGDITTSSKITTGAILPSPFCNHHQWFMFNGNVGVSR